MDDTALTFGPRAVPLSVLDLAPVPDDGTAGDALRATIDLARHAERLGFRRFWVAEHHNMPGIASSAPPVLIGHIADATTTMRVGSGGVMLLPSPEEAAAYPYSDSERAFVEDRQASQIIGSPGTVRRGVAGLLEATQADELMITTMVFDPADRLTSFNLVADLARASAGAPASR